jgi:hypothetical protein
MGSPPSSTSAAAAGLSLPSMGSQRDSDSSDSLENMIFPSGRPLDRPSQSIEVPFEIVLVCRQDDVLIHPGGYTLSAEAIRRGRRDHGEGLLTRELRAIVRRRAQIDPLIRPRPSIKFLVETNGSSTFWTIQRQLLFSGLDWPMSLRVAGPQKTLSLLGE